MVNLKLLKEIMLSSSLHLLPRQKDMLQDQENLKWCHKNQTILEILKTEKNVKNENLKLNHNEKNQKKNHLHNNQQKNKKVK